MCCQSVAGLELTLTDDSRLRHPRDDRPDDLGRNVVRNRTDASDIVAAQSPFQQQPLEKLSFELVPERSAIVWT